MLGFGAILGFLSASALAPASLPPNKLKPVFGALGFPAATFLEVGTGVFCALSGAGLAPGFAGSLETLVGGGMGFFRAVDAAGFLSPPPKRLKGLPLLVEPLLLAAFEADLGASCGFFKGEGVEGGLLIMTGGGGGLAFLTTGGGTGLPAPTDGGDLAV